MHFSNSLCAKKRPKSVVFLYDNCGTLGEWASSRWHELRAVGDASVVRDRLLWCGLVVQTSDSEASYILRRLHLSGILINSVSQIFDCVWRF